MGHKDIGVHSCASCHGSWGPMMMRPAATVAAVQRRCWTGDGFVPLLTLLTSFGTAMQLDDVRAPSNRQNVSINVPPSVVAANSLPWRRNGVHVN